MERTWQSKDVSLSFLIFFLLHFCLFLVNVPQSSFSSSCLSLSKRNRDAGASSSSAVQIGRRRKCRRFDGLSVLPEYIDNGDCTWVCEYCSSFFWYVEKAPNMSTFTHPRYTHCCRGGSVVLPCPSRFPSQFIRLYESQKILNDVRAYNSMFSMTSSGANVDDDVNHSRGPYVFKITRLKIGLAESNEYVRTFKNAKQIAEEMDLESYVVRLFNHIQDRRYDLPLPGSLGCIVTGDDTTSTTYDIIIHSQQGHPQRISKLHPNYMPLQYPLLFPFGEEGWSPCLKLGNRRGANAQNLTQYLVDVYTCIEESRLDYIVRHQSNLRSDCVSGLYDALSKGDRDAGSIGKWVFLPASFTGGPCFMYSHYLDALSICRVYGNP
ncbi:unnamed protein product [Lactuca saligna]|uniref:Helitron helicase-like domain-containing protein n=1 Tax=Lactuca saligna TaxID=75948 RepID=A0AA35YTH2_LACSI|nr:unnamed protein product [Lactuca saligna]